MRESWRLTLAALCIAAFQILPSGVVRAQSFGSSTLDFNALGSVSSATSLEFGPDGRLYVLQINGTIDVLTIVRDAVNDYRVVNAEEILDVKNIPNHNDDGRDRKSVV